MENTYDLAVIGAGTAAMSAANRVRRAGWRVAVIDRRPFGGTCALRGCDPKKMLLGGTEAVDHARRMAEKGVSGAVDIAWPDLIAFKRTFTDPVPGKHERHYADVGIDTFHGHARFVGRTSLAVGDHRLDCRHILLATGAEPVRLGIPGEAHLATNETFLELPALPSRIVFVGGGYIAAEFAHIAARAGAEVTILQRADRLLTGFDPDLVDWLTERFRNLGIRIMCSTTVEAIEKTADGFRVHAGTAGGPIAADASLVVHAAGRAPPLDDLDLAAGGVDEHGGRVSLNEFLQSTSNPAVYAAGDTARAGPPLTPVSSYDARVVASNLLKGNHRRPEYLGVPSVAFTIPPIASVGLSETEARARGHRLRVRSERTSGWFTARQQAEPVSGYKTLLDEETDLILGAHLVGPHAEAVINLFALAIRHGLTATDLKTTMFAYPTGASDIGSMLS